uniref:Ubiquitin-like domain-containing protein n=1 Tax=Angiostrongylus costaricensis TaxID=334426 RepID=A0A0R3PVT6_ANGCS
LWIYSIVIEALLCSLRFEVHELFFEIVREKQHVFCDAKDSAPVLELKKIVEGIPVNDQILVRLIDDNVNNFQPLDNKKTLAESGFNVNNAKAQSPAVVALMFKGESAPIIDELSTPPPIPDAMRNETHSQE